MLHEKHRQCINIETEKHCKLELENTYQFFKDLNLLLNEDKTNCIQFKTKQNRNRREPVINLNSEQITIKSSAHFLGLTIDQLLDWNSYVDKVLTKISSGLYAMKKMSYY
jgi:hypothetical protein